MLTKTKLMNNVGISRISKQMFENFSTSSVYRSHDLSNHHDSEDNNPDTPFEFTHANLQRIVNLMKNYPTGHERAALLPTMDIAQRQFGWLPISAMHRVADMLCIPRMRVYEVASFYTMYKRRYRGKYHVKVCGTTPCWLRGAEEIMDAAKAATGAPEGGLSPDGMFGLDTVECAGACANAPVLVVDDDYYEDVTPHDVCQIIACIRNGGVPPAGPRNGRGSCEPISGLTTLLTPPPPPGCGLQPALSGSPSAPPAPKTPPTPPHAPKPQQSGGSPIKPRTKPSDRTRICGGAISGPCRPKEPTTHQSLMAPQMKTDGPPRLPTQKLFGPAPQMKADEPPCLPTQKPFGPSKFKKHEPYQKSKGPKGAFSSPMTDQKKTEPLQMFEKPAQLINAAPDISHLKAKKLISPFGPTELKIQKPAEKSKPKSKIIETEVETQSVDKPISSVYSKKITTPETIAQIPKSDDVISADLIVKPKAEKETLKPRMSAFRAIKKLLTGTPVEKSESASLTKSDTGMDLTTKPEKERSDSFPRPTIKSQFKEPLESTLKSESTTFEIKGPKTYLKPEIWESGKESPKTPKPKSTLSALKRIFTGEIESKPQEITTKLTTFDDEVKTLKPSEKSDGNKKSEEHPKKSVSETKGSPLSAIKKLFSSATKESLPEVKFKPTTPRSTFSEQMKEDVLKTGTKVLETREPKEQSSTKAKREEVTKMSKMDRDISSDPLIKPETKKQSKTSPKIETEAFVKRKSLTKLDSETRKDCDMIQKIQTHVPEIKEPKEQSPKKQGKEDAPKMTSMDTDISLEPIAKPKTSTESKTSPKIDEFEPKSPLSAIKKILSFPTKESPPDKPPKLAERSAFLEQMKKGVFKSETKESETKKPKEQSLTKPKREEITKMTKMDIDISSDPLIKPETKKQTKISPKIETETFVIREPKRQSPIEQEKDDAPKLKKSDSEISPESFVTYETRKDCEIIQKIQTQIPVIKEPKEQSPTKHEKEDGPKMMKWDGKISPGSFSKTETRKDSEITQKLQTDISEIKEPMGKSLIKQEKEDAPKMTSKDTDISLEPIAKPEPRIESKTSLKIDEFEPKSPFNAIKKIFSFPTKESPPDTPPKPVDRSKFLEQMKQGVFKSRSLTFVEKENSQIKMEPPVTSPKMTKLGDEVKTSKSGENITENPEKPGPKTKGSPLSAIDKLCSASVSELSSDDKSLSDYTLPPKTQIKPDNKKQETQSPEKSQIDKSPPETSEFYADASTLRKRSEDYVIKTYVETCPAKSDLDIPTLEKSKLESDISSKPTVKPTFWDEIEQSPVKGSEKLSPRISKSDFMTTAEPIIKENVEKSLLDSESENISPTVLKSNVAVSSKPPPETKIEQNAIESETGISKPVVTVLAKAAEKQSLSKSEAETTPLKWLESDAVGSSKPESIPDTKEHTSPLKPDSKEIPVKQLKSDRAIPQTGIEIPGLKDVIERSLPKGTPKLTELDYILSPKKQNEQSTITPEKPAASLITTKKLLTSTPAKRLAPRKTKTDKNVIVVPEQMDQRISEKDTPFKPKSISKPETKAQIKDSKETPEPNTIDSALGALKKIFSVSTDSTGKIIPAPKPQGEASKSHFKPTAELETKEQNKQSPFKYDNETAAALKTISKLFSATPSKIADLTEKETNIKGTPKSATERKRPAEVPSPELTIEPETMEKEEPEKQKIKISKVKKLSDAGKESLIDIDKDTEVRKKTKSDEKRRPSDDSKAMMDSPSPSTEILSTSSTSTKSMDPVSDPPSPLTSATLKSNAKEASDTSKKKEDINTADGENLKLEHVCNEHEKTDSPPPVLLERPREITKPNQEKDKDKEDNDDIDPKKK